LQAIAARHAAHARWLERVQFDRLHPGSPFSHDALDQMAADWRCLEAHDELEAIEHRLGHADHLTCPRCRHRWPADPATVGRLAGRRAALLALIDGRARPSQPALSVNDIARHRALLADRAARAVDRRRLEDACDVPAPALSLAEIAHAKVANARGAERQAIEARLAEFAPTGPDWKVLFEQRSVYERDLARYQSDRLRYANWLAERQKKERRARQLVLAVAPLAVFQRQLSAALGYEQQLATCEEHKTRFDALSAEVDHKRSASRQWASVKDAMTILRGLVQRFN
jgi:hypothetical protein